METMERYEVRTVTELNAYIGCVVCNQPTAGEGGKTLHVVRLDADGQPVVDWTGAEVTYPFCSTCWQGGPQLAAARARFEAAECRAGWHDSLGRCYPWEDGKVPAVHEDCARMFEAKAKAVAAVADWPRPEPR